MILAGMEETLRVNAPIRVKSGSFLRDHGYFRKQAALAAAKAAQGGCHFSAMADLA